MFWKILQFSLFQCLKTAFVLLTFQFQVCSTLGKQLSHFRAKISGFAFSPTSKRSLQVCVVHVSIPPAAPKASRRWLCSATALVRCREDSRKNPKCAGIKENSWASFFFVKADVLFWMRSSFVYLDDSVRIPSYVPSSLRHHCGSWRLMFLKSVTVYRTTPPWKITAMKPENSQQQERSTLSGHTQRCSDGRGWEQHPVPRQDDRFGAKHRRLFLWSVREHHIRVVQRSAFV